MAPRRGRVAASGLEIVPGAVSRASRAEFSPGRGAATDAPRARAPGLSRSPQGRSASELAGDRASTAGARTSAPRPERRGLPLESSTLDCVRAAQGSPRDTRTTTHRTTASGSPLRALIALRHSSLCCRRASALSVLHISGGHESAVFSGQTRPLRFDARHADRASRASTHGRGQVPDVRNHRRGRACAHGRALVPGRACTRAMPRPCVHARDPPTCVPRVKPRKTRLAPENCRFLPAGDV